MHLPVLQFGFAPLREPAARHKTPGGGKQRYVPLFFRCRAFCAVSPPAVGKQVERIKLAPLYNVAPGECRGREFIQLDGPPTGAGGTARNARQWESTARTALFRSWAFRGVPPAAVEEQLSWVN